MRAQARPPLDRRLAELAGAQWGVVTLKQLAAIGLARGAVQHRVREGRLHRVYRGVYAVGHELLGREGRALAAVLACGPSAVLSHLSAAAWWGLLETAGAKVDVTAARGRHGAPGIRLHRSRSLDARDTTTHQGMPITTVARTLLDLAATLTPHRLERALAQAERLRLYDLRAIRDVLARANGHRGRAPLAGAVTHEPQLTRNELEALFLDLVRQAGLPEPTVNAALDAPDHGRLDPDFYWPTLRLIVETDGYDTHHTRAAFRNDRRRDAALVAAGYIVLRFTERDVKYDAATVVRRLRAGCSRASASAPAPASSAASPAP